MYKHACASNLQLKRLRAAPAEPRAAGKQHDTGKDSVEHILITALLDLPHTLRAVHGSWFELCRAEGDLDASEDRVVERFGAWLGMLETTSLNKSYKMVVLRVLLDRDALWDGLENRRLTGAL